MFIREAISYERLDNYFGGTYEFILGNSENAIFEYIQSQWYASWEKLLGRMENDLTIDNFFFHSHYREKGNFYVDRYSLIRRIKNGYALRRNKFSVNSLVPRMPVYNRRYSGRLWSNHFRCVSSRNRYMEALWIDVRRKIGGKEKQFWLKIRRNYKGWHVKTNRSRAITKISGLFRLGILGFADVD